MTEILGTLTGWEVEEGDFIILQGTECHVLELVDDSPADHSVFRVHDTENDLTDKVKIYLTQDYEVWGG